MGWSIIRLYPLNKVGGSASTSLRTGILWTLRRVSWPSGERTKSIYSFAAFGCEACSCQGYRVEADRNGFQGNPIDWCAIAANQLNGARHRDEQRMLASRNKLHTRANSHVLRRVAGMQASSDSPPLFLFPTKGSDPGGAHNHLDQWIFCFLSTEGLKVRHKFSRRLRRFQPRLLSPTATQRGSHKSRSNIPLGLEGSGPTAFRLPESCMERATFFRLSRAWASTCSSRPSCAFPPMPLS